MNSGIANQTIANEWHGSLELVFAKTENTTELIHNRVQAPLKVQRPFYPEGKEVCHSVVLHTAGGIVGGDRLSLNFQLQQQAKAVITTAAASKIYRSNGLQARQTIEMQVDADACLEWLPQETIVFNGANYRQDLRVELAPGASWLSWEITRFGRTARGERFIQGEWRSHTEVWQQGIPLWVDRQWLPGSEEIINSPHGLAAQPVVASLAWIGQPVSPEIVEKARNLITNYELQQLLPSEVSSPLNRQRITNYGVTRLPSGLLCRYRGDSTSQVRNWFTAVWQLLRVSYLKRPSCPPRVWLL